MKKLLFLASILAISCSSDDTNNPDNTALNLVTGINYRQSPEDVPLQLGNPNVLVNNKFVIYPNPANEIVNVSAQENITDVWVVRGNAQKIYQDVNFSSILNTSLYTQQSIATQSDFSLNGQASDGIGMNIGTLEKGYYRVFVKIGGQIYWDNLYKYENGGNNEEGFAELSTFWE